MSATAQPDPQIDTEPTVEIGEDCGIPCFAVGWDGVSAGTVTITIWLNTSPPTMIERSISLGNVGEFCLNAGMSCP